STPRQGEIGAAAYHAGECASCPSGRIRRGRARRARNVGQLIAIVRDASDRRLPDLARPVLRVLATQVELAQAAVAKVEKELTAWHRSNPLSQRLATIPGIGPIIATAIAAMVVEPSGF